MMMMMMLNAFVLPRTTVNLKFTTSDTENCMVIRIVYVHNFIVFTNLRAVYL